MKKKEKEKRNLLTPPFTPLSYSEIINVVQIIPQISDT